MKVIEKHLYFRNGYYYFRSALPRYLHEPLALKEVVIALGTQDLSEGRMFSVKLDYELEKHLREFQSALNMLKPDQSPEHALDRLISQISGLRNQVGYGFPQSAKALKVHRPLFSDIVKKYLADCTNTHGTHFHKDNTYTLFIQLVYVLHCFQKKSKSGIATPPKDMELIKSRLKLAIEGSKETKRK